MFLPACALINIDTYMHTSTQTQIYTQAHAYTHTSICIHIHTHLHTHRHIHKCMHTHTQKHTHKHTHADTYMRTYTHTCTQTHTDTHETLFRGQILTGLPCCYLLVGWHCVSHSPLLWLSFFTAASQFLEGTVFTLPKGKPLNILLLKKKSQIPRHTIRFLKHFKTDNSMAFQDIPSVA